MAMESHGTENLLHLFSPSLRCVHFGSLCELFPFRMLRGNNGGRRIGATENETDFRAAVSVLRPAGTIISNTFR